jgi:GTP-binding protein
LEEYGHGLGERPEVIAVSKAELPGAEEVRERLVAATGKEVLLFSSVTGQGLDRVLSQAYAVRLTEPV